MQTSLSPSVCGAFLSCQIEKAVDELNLTKKIISWNPSNLPLPDQVDCFLALNRSPSRLEFSEALLGVHATFDGSMILFEKASVITQKFGALLWRVHSTGNLRCARGTLQTQEGWLDSHDRSPPGAIVPVQKSDFGCCGPLFGGEICALKRGRSRPRWKACVMIANRVEPSQFQ
jgi:hypothetical protein